MIDSVDVEPIGIRFDDLACFGAELVIFGIHYVPDAKEGYEIIGRRRVGTVDRGKVAARRQQDLLNGEKVIFAVGVGETIGRIRIGMTEDMRHAVSVT